MKIKKAIIPVAGYGTRFLPATKASPKPMLPIIDKPTIQYIVEEAAASGIEEILFITSSANKAIEDHFDRNFELETILKEKGKDKELEKVTSISKLARIHYVRQQEQLGLGHAILCGKAFVGNEPFAVLLGDNVFVGEVPATKQLIDVYKKTGASVVGTQKVSDEDIHKFGICMPFDDLEDGDTACKIKEFVEKPKPTEVVSRMAALGRYVLTPKLFELLETQGKGKGNEIQLTDSIERLIEFEDVYALNMKNDFHDIGSKIGFIKATIEFALNRDDLKGEVSDLIQNLKSA
ncbi:UTP--glucose-1-phosphate uridylyltransferase GalU [Mycoplasmatota bacterium WC44]